MTIESVESLWSCSISQILVNVVCVKDPSSSTHFPTPLQYLWLTVPRQSFLWGEAIRWWKKNQKKHCLIKYSTNRWYTQNAAAHNLMARLNSIPNLHTHRRLFIYIPWNASQRRASTHNDARELYFEALTHKNGILYNIPVVKARTSYYGHLTYSNWSAVSKRQVIILSRWTAASSESFSWNLFLGMFDSYSNTREWCSEVS